MGEFYGKKIKKGEINPKTGEAWKLADVPKLYRAKVEAWLEAHAND